MGTSVEMIERHYGTLLDGSGAGIAKARIVDQQPPAAAVEGQVLDVEGGGGEHTPGLRRPAAESFATIIAIPFPAGGRQRHVAAAERQRLDLYI